MSTTTLNVSQRRFLKRVNFTCAWGEGVDGFDLGLLSAVLPLVIVGLGASPLEAGLIAAASLIGIFLGAPLVGLLTDKFGRQNLFMADLALFVVLGLLQAVVTEPWQLFVVRVLLGVAIGAEYALGGAMLAEFVPSHGRGRRIAAMVVCWYVGYLAAVVVGFALVEFTGLSWRWILATSTIPAVVTILARIGLPESPRWLANNGRIDEARAIVDRCLGAAYYDEEKLDGEPQRGGGLRKALTGENGKRVAFCSILWGANVTPYFAIFTFAPVVLSSLAIENETLGTITLNAMAAVGAFIGMLTLEQFGRRLQAIAAFWIMAGSLGVIGLWGAAPGFIVVACFAIFSLFAAAQCNLTIVYPSEILPTEVRATGIGIAAAVSRIGAAIGTFLLPIGLDHWGAGPCMVIGALICVAGGLVSHVMAPETTGQTLTDACRTDDASAFDGAELTTRA